MNGPNGRQLLGKWEYLLGDGKAGAERLTDLTSAKVDALTKDELRFELGSRELAFKGTAEALKARLKLAVENLPTVLVKRHMQKLDLGAGRTTYGAWFPNECPRATIDHVGMLTQVQDIRTLDNVSKGENSRRPAAGQKMIAKKRKERTAATSGQKTAKLAKKAGCR